MSNAEIALEEIVVGANTLSLPSPWRWRRVNGSWSAENVVIAPNFCVSVRADLRGDEGVHVLVDDFPHCVYVPAVVIALVVLANEGGAFNNMLPVLSRYVTPASKNEEKRDAD